jgi:hypothetical protein
LKPVFPAPCDSDLGSFKDFAISMVGGTGLEPVTSTV